jgi:hypothetical protein
MVISEMLIAWPRGGQLAWSNATHKMFPAAFRADVAAALLATLGSPETAGRRGAKAAACAGGGSEPTGGGTLRNPLRMMREQYLLEMVFKALLKLHVGVPAA